MLLLDTCTFLWLVSAQEKLSMAARTAICDNSYELYISAITGFEIALKHQKRRLVLPFNPDEWIARALEQHCVEVLPVTCTIAIASAGLPAIHWDPCDRFIVATAIYNNLAVVTADSHIAQYPDVSVIW